MSEGQLPPAAVIINYKVADFDQWKSVFDSNEQGRADNGFLGHHINRAEHDPNDLSIYLAVGDVQAAQDYLISAELKTLMQQAGALGPPARTWVKPLRESIVWDGELPALMASHAVSDVDRWLAGYDETDEIRRSAGIIGHAANTAIDNPSHVLVYHQAKSFEDLRAFAGSEDLKAAMQEAGATSAPEFTFHTGGFGQRY